MILLLCCCSCSDATVFGFAAFVVCVVGVVAAGVVVGVVGVVVAVFVAAVVIVVVVAVAAVSAVVAVVAAVVATVAAAAVSISVALLLTNYREDISVQSAPCINTPQAVRLHQDLAVVRHSPLRMTQTTPNTNLQLALSIQSLHRKPMSVYDLS